MPVKVNKDGTDYYLVPAPLVTYEKSFQRAANGQILGTTYNVTLDGNIIPNKGNPTASGSSGSFSTDSWVSSFSSDDDPLQSNQPVDVLAATIAKQQTILDVFSSGTALLVSIFGYDRPSGITFFGNVENVSFPNDGRWALPSTYQIVLSTNALDVEPESFNYYISDATETWSVQENDQSSLIFNGQALESVAKVYQVSHTVSAIGKPVYTSGGGYLDGKAPWQQASGYVRSVLGIGTGNVPNSLIVPIFSASGYGYANRTISEDIDELGGSYSLTENFLAYRTGIAPFPVLESMSVTTSRGEEGIQNIQVEGVIQGLDDFQNSSLSNRKNAYYNASGYYDNISTHAYNRALNITGLNWIHPIAVGQSTARNINEGNITYSLTYNDRPPNIISGSISENISIQDTYPGQIFAAVPVIGRDQPVLQYLNSRTEYSRTLSIDIVMQRITNNWNTGVSGAPVNGYWQSATTGNIHNWLFQQKPSVLQSSGLNLIFQAANPANDSGVVSSKVFYGPPVENWNPRDGRYSYQITFTYQRK